MDIEEYVNEPVNEGRNISANRKISRSGLFKVILVVGISFCLLCIIQAVLNVTLRLHGDGLCNKTHTTDISPVLQDGNDGLSGEKNQNCDQDWTQYMSSCYQLSAKKDSWWNAKDDCIVNGANLVIIENEKEENALQNAFGGLAVWIGLKAEKTKEGFLNWKWVDGRQLTYGKTIQQPPFEHGNRHTCVYVKQSPPGLMSWNHDACSSKLHWLCQKKLQ